ncbi:MAG: hypothetical protein SFX19_08680 [Alphaproteobacteria bacterium]|nr:hypothetical protein [Alphaproteobacteria bacterium]
MLKKYDRKKLRELDEKTRSLLDEAKGNLPEAKVFDKNSGVFKYLKSLFGEEHPELFVDAERDRALTHGLMVIRLPEDSKIDVMLQQEWQVEMTPVTIPGSDSTPPPINLFLITHNAMRKQVHEKTGKKYSEVYGAQSNSLDLETELKARAEAAGFKTSIMR